VYTFGSSGDPMRRRTIASTGPCYLGCDWISAPLSWANPSSEPPDSGSAMSSVAHRQRTRTGAGDSIPRCTTCRDQVSKVCSANLSAAASTSARVDVPTATPLRCRHAHTATGGTIDTIATSVPN
jgi:hypothetical protein